MEEFIKDLAELIKKHGFDHDLGVTAEKLSTIIFEELSAMGKSSLG